MLEDNQDTLFLVKVFILSIKWECTNEYREKVRDLERR